MSRSLRLLAARSLQALWPAGLGGRTILVLTAAVVFVHLGTVLVYDDTMGDRSGRSLADQVAGRLATAARVLDHSDIAERDSRVHALSTPGLDLHWGDHATVLPTAPTTALRGFRNRMAELAPDLGDVTLQFGSADTLDDAAVLNGSVRLDDGTFLNFGSTLGGAAAPWTLHSTLTSTTLMAVGVAAIAALLVRGLIRPLRHLAGAADAIGHGPEVPVAETGPQEVRHVARAFNAMQARIHRLVDDRTEALAAVSHDLRTPITRLRLRAGFLEDQETQAAIDADLDEMEAMIEATLAYLRGDFESEPKQVTDLAALLSTLVDQASDAGADASYVGPNHVAVELHPSLVKRAFANLVNNAVSYGGNARVTLAVLESSIQIKVEDDGPGIPTDDLERVFLPFKRLDASRNRGTGGVGLGLAIARRGIENDGGELRLSNRLDGGLCALVNLPLRALVGPPLSVERLGTLVANGDLPQIPANVTHASR
jgi:signal transduction histidine kinase